MSDNRKSNLYFVGTIIGVPLTLLVAFLAATSSDDGYAAMLRHMPAGLRDRYCTCVLENAYGSPDQDSGGGLGNPGGLFDVFLKHRELLTPGIKGEIYDIAISNKDDPPGIVALQIALDSKDGSLICRLRNSPGFRDAFDSKVKLYRETSTKQDVLDLDRIISSC